MEGFTRHVSVSRLTQRWKFPGRRRSHTPMDGFMKHLAVAFFVPRHQLGRAVIAQTEPRCARTQQTMQQAASRHQNLSTRKSHSQWFPGREFFWNDLQVAKRCPLSRSACCRMRGIRRTSTRVRFCGRMPQMFTEHPRARRYLFAVVIELTDLQSETQIRERTSDLSLFGCHVNTSKLFSTGTRVRIRIAHRGANFAALGTVVYEGPNAGKGITFTKIEQKDQLALEKWSDELRDEEESRFQDREARANPELRAPVLPVRATASGSASLSLAPSSVCFSSMFS
jgi:PilZ domain